MDEHISKPVNLERLYNTILSNSKIAKKIAKK
jgi:hypothetical protein